jgi:lysophospholipase L1-like esterase
MKLRMLLFCLIVCHSVISQPKSLRFDFGTDRVKKGWTAVTPATVFNRSTGYGFSHGSTPIAVDRGGDPLQGDFITSDAPLYFSIVLPEGNYRVSVTVGDLKGTSSTIVRAECRRLMSEQTITRKGETRTVSFLVHVRDSLIRNALGEPVSKVRLKPREHAYLHWDDLLTLEFNDSLPKICALSIEPVTDRPVIFLAGNSTVVDQDREPWAAWGQMFPVMLNPDAAVVANYAESGEAMKSFKSARRLDKIWSLAKPGDYLFIEFTHNDQKPGGSHLDPFTTYRQTIREWIAEAGKRKVQPVLVTSMHRRNFDSHGKIVNTLGEYPEDMRQIAALDNVPLVDLNAMSKTLYEAWGPETSKKAFVHFPANSFPGQDTKLEDNTHFSTYGAYQLARCVAAALAASGTPIASMIRSGFRKFDPAYPPGFDRFYLPPGRPAAAIKPDGN